MSSQIIQSIKSFIPINAEEEKAFIDIIKIKEFKKKEFLLREGEICNKISFINKGSMRCFYTVDGIENTIQFFFEDSWYTDYDSFLTETPAKENLQALEDSEVVEFHKQDLYLLYETHPIFHSVGRVMAENAFISLSKINKMLTNEEPEERYLNLIKQRPNVIEKIPQHYIASYLGVKPETLSRIRKRIQT